jgi:hypothetical protein
MQKTLTSQTTTAQSQLLVSNLTAQGRGT